MKTERRYDIDWLRVIAIGLLLIYHIAIVFQPWALFVGFVKSDEPMNALWKPMTLLNVWRIPFLFYVSGMGVYFALGKRNWQQLIGERAKRILLPFLFGIIAITPLHMILFQKFYKMPLSYYPHMGHLWFLGNIFCYVLILLPVFYYLKHRPESGFKMIAAKIMSNPLGPLSVTLLFVLETLLVKPQIFAMYAETWHGFFLGLIAFACGFLLMYSGTSFWQTVLKWKWGYFGLALVLYLVRYSIFNLEAPGYLMAIESNCWIFWIFGLGYQFLNKPGKLLSYLSKAAYPVYIIHMFVLYAGANLILPLSIPVTLQFIVLTLFTFILCFLLYEFIIRRIRILHPIFGLKWEFSKINEQIETISVQE
ncbi:acyltransferase family protein [Robertkochia solimangrovi]|uniref:acyltransferase family protein n=1 Tax=Robertkochia solimangrovi TaxID=2213046 RepID=UPI00117F64D1|nr:acyltransferase family protein [Robertkochia solimangrovi]TRZ45097.1 acyltransferase [Robertkochia solimangrovi]